MTNREKLFEVLNRMPNKELAENLEMICGTCPATEYCDKLPQDYTCSAAMLKWLEEGEEK